MIFSTGRASGLSRELMPVAPVATDHLAKIIEGPAGIAGIDIEDGLTETMIRDIENQDALPLLAFTLRELYEHCGDDKLFEVHEYREKLGGLNGAVARAADAVLRFSIVYRSGGSAEECPRLIGSY